MRKRYDFETDINSSEEVALDEARKTRNSIHSVPVSVAFGALALLGGLYFFTFLADSRLPTPLKLSDEITRPEAFITERAQHDLKLLTEIGPRVASSYENEILTVDFLKREINFIIQSSNKTQEIELDLQTVTGSHYLNSTPGKYLAYSNLQNVVVKLHGANDSNASLLVNSHFDSVPTSPGGSDDGINVIVMLEILRKLSREKKRQVHNVIFLFNGAEETGLQAAHGFITQHKWAKETKAVLNLEAAGAGGKIILFQSGPATPWLMKYYNRVPHPYAQAAGEEIFQSGIIPSDTDFRIFRDYGDLVGIDMAFFKSGHRYHTKYDDFDHIPLGSFQHVGDNTLSLVRDLANAPELLNPKEQHQKVIFFDFLGLFMISYSEFTGQILNYTVVVLSMLLFAFSIFNFKLGYNFKTFIYLNLSVGAIILGWVLAAIFVSLTALFLDLCGFSMSWYGQPWLLIGLYAIPTIAITPILLPLISHNKFSENIKAHIQVDSVRAIWTGLLFIGTLFKIRAMYSLLIPVTFSVASVAIIHLLKLQPTVRKWQIVYVISLIIPTIFAMYTSLTTMSLFIPITGRIGSNKNIELIMGIMTMVFTILITSPFIALVTLVRNFKYVLAFLLVMFLINFITVFTPLGFPYSSDKDSPSPERFWIVHSRRIFRDESGSEIKRDSGYFLLNLDRNSPHKVKKYVKEMDKIKSVQEDCETNLLCGFPLIHSKMIEILKHSSWIPAGQPVFQETPKFELVSKTYLAPTIIRYNISITGADRLGLYVSPNHNVKMIGTSLANGTPPIKKTATWNHRLLYFFIHLYGKERAAFEFSFDVEVPPTFNGTAVEIGVTAVYVHDNDNQKVPHFVQFLNQFPDWAEITPFLGSFENWWI